MAQFEFLVPVSLKNEKEQNKAKAGQVESDPQQVRPHSSSHFIWTDQTIESPLIKYIYFCLVTTTELIKHTSSK